MQIKDFKIRLGSPPTIDIDLTCTAAVAGNYAAVSPTAVTHSFRALGALAFRHCLLPWASL